MSLVVPASIVSSSITVVSRGRGEPPTVTCTEDSTGSFVPSETVTGTSRTVPLGAFGVAVAVKTEPSTDTSISGFSVYFPRAKVRSSPSGSSTPGARSTVAWPSPCATSSSAPWKVGGRFSSSGATSTGIASVAVAAVASPTAPSVTSTLMVSLPEKSAAGR